MVGFVIPVPMIASPTTSLWLLQRMVACQAEHARIDGDRRE